jgi:hypothetical protein
MTIHIAVYRTGCLGATHATGMANWATTCSAWMSIWRSSPNWSSDVLGLVRVPAP